MGFADEYNDELKSIEARFDGGLSNTSTRKFDELVKIVSEITEIEVEKIYITAATSRASNLWNRLAQGKPLTQHFSLAVGIIDADDLQGGLLPASKFIGSGVGHYDAIALTVKKNGKWVIGAVLDTMVLPVYDKFVEAFPQSTITHDEVSLSDYSNSGEVSLAWYVGATGEDENGKWQDFSDIYINQGIWVNGYDDKFVDVVKRIKVGEHIVIKSVFNQKNNIPFNNNGRKVGAMRLKATGVVTENLGDGKNLKVDWKRLSPVKTWYGPGTLRTTIHCIKAEDGPIKKQLLDFTFGDENQDYALCEEYYAEELENSSNDDSDGLGNTDVSEGSVYDTNSSCLDIERNSVSDRVHPFNFIVYGAPGTGKTYSMVEYALAIIDNVKVEDFKKNNTERKANVERYKQFVKAGRIVFTTFHQNYGYEEFIQGLRPDKDSEVMKFKTVDGVFKTIADKALKHSNDERFVIIIDEINRANISKVFGELITLIEKDKRWGEENETSVTLQSGEPFAVPNNLYIVGTMNSADKSISLIDAALRRRFDFIEQKPNAELVKDSVLQTIFKKINAKLVKDLCSTDLLVGHSYFMNNTESDLQDILNNNIIPLLYEYYYDDRKKVKNLLESVIKESNAKVEVVDEEVGRLRVKEKAEDDSGQV